MKEVIDHIIEEVVIEIDKEVQNNHVDIEKDQEVHEEDLEVHHLNKDQEVQVQDKYNKTFFIFISYS